ncbi:MAG: hypothetical protein RIS21_444 [Planctomycetota bacterium]
MRTLLLASVLLFAVSCAAGGGAAVTSNDAVSSTPKAPYGIWGEAVSTATSVEGRTIEAYKLGDGPTTVLFVGVVHGSEPVGQGLLGRFIEELKLNKAALAGRTAIVVPVLNPDGLAANTRTNARGVDLNRNFPAGNFDASARRGPEPLSEPESKFLHALITTWKPVRIVAVHQPLRCINFDGPVGDLAAEMARLSLFPLKSDIGFPTPGSLGSWAGRDLGIGVITLEHTPSNDVLQAWIQHRESLLLALKGI